MSRLFDLFPTRVYRSPLAPETALGALVSELEEACRMLAAEDEAGRAWCRRNGYSGYTSYASLDDLPTRASVFGSLRRRLDGHVAEFARALHYDLNGRRLRLDSLWANVLEPKGAHSGHIHPKSVISGTLYVALPEGSGALRFEDPRLGLMMAAPPVGSEAPPSERRFVYVEPDVGEVVLWESWLRHEVLPHRGRGQRISLSFNYA